MSYCSLCGILGVPVDAKVVRSRQPSIFQANQLEIQEGDAVRVERVHTDGNCEIWHERLQCRGLAPINYLQFEPA
ncbi:proto oncolocus tag crk [Echinococcus multilocularis]|nr:proto oncogene crk [Echinococcus granulosus]CDS42527.1 proto oncolocus tag crk [Echinococcus multilocularis]